MVNNNTGYVHLYSRAEDGRMIFYGKRDYLVFFSILSVSLRRIEADVISLCIMPNHFHLLVRTSDLNRLLHAVAEAKRDFGRKYNARCSRAGKVFKRLTGFAWKNTGKQLRSCIAYVNNNPVVGHLCSSAEQYRWNLLYCFGRRPVRDKFHSGDDGWIPGIVNAKNIIDSYFLAGKPLSYEALDTAFEFAGNGRSESLTDYIVLKYNFLDYDRMLRHFGGFKDAIQVFSLIRGEEYDIREDYEDYSIYGRMSDAMCQAGYDTDASSILNLDESVKSQIIRYLHAMTGGTARQLARYLHLPL